MVWYWWEPICHWVFLSMQTFCMFSFFITKGLAMMELSFYNLEQSLIKVWSKPQGHHQPTILILGVIKEDSKFLQAESRHQNRITKPSISLIFFNYLRPPIQCVLQVTKLIRLSVRPYTYNGNNNVTSNPAWRQEHILQYWWSKGDHHWNRRVWYCCGPEYADWNNSFQQQIIILCYASWQRQRCPCLSEGLHSQSNCEWNGWCDCQLLLHNVLWQQTHATLPKDCRCHDQG